MVWQGVTRDLVRRGVAREEGEELNVDVVWGIALPTLTHACAVYTARLERLFP